MRYKRLRDFVGCSCESLDAALRQVADELGDVEETGALQIRTVGDKDGRCRVLDLDSDGCSVKEEPVHEPRLELIARSETLLKVFDGSYSPIQAFLDGKMRVRGDVAFGRALLSNLASSESGQDKCA